MIISTTPIDCRRPAGCAQARRSPAGGFTLIEVMVALTLSMLVLAGVMSSFLMIGRTAMNVANYSTAETEIRRGIEDFSQDVRMASNVQWNSPVSITLTVAANPEYAGSGNRVTYAFDTSATGPTARSFYRKLGDASSTAAPRIYVREISDFSYTRFNRLNAVAATDPETKRIQITMNVRRIRNTVVAANTTLVSASYTLRNKPIN